MNHCGIQQKSNFSSFGNNGEPMVCPKPRRLHLLNTTINEPIKPQFHMWSGSEQYLSKFGLLDIMSHPENPHPLYDETQNQTSSYVSSDQTQNQTSSYFSSEQTQIQTIIPSSPPFFCGSPPSRVSNPLIQDARFKEEKISPIVLNTSSGIISSSSQSCFRTSYGNKPSVRIEGFNCNRGNCSVPALA